MSPVRMKVKRLQVLHPLPESRALRLPPPDKFDAKAAMEQETAVTAV